MSDPAIKAAQEAWRMNANRAPYPTEKDLMELAAREALAPYRDRHRPFTRDYPGGDGRTVCAYCHGPKTWPCPDAQDAYTTEELER